MERRKLLGALAGVGLSSLVAPASSLLGGRVFSVLWGGARSEGLEVFLGTAHAAPGPARDGRWNLGSSGDQGAKAAADAAVPDLAVARGKSPEELVGAAIDALGGMSRFVSKGDRVLVKPNIGWDRTPEQAANTNPTVVRTVIDLCFKSGAERVLLVDHTCNEARRCYVRSGISKAAEEAGATVKYIDEKKFKEMKIGGEVVKDWPVYRDFVEVDKLINIPIAKHHTLARLSLSMKNWIGAVGGRRNQLHQKLDDVVVDLAFFFKPTLTVLDAVRILKANGPQGGNLKDVEKLDTVAAGVDEVAIDSFGATLFGFKGEDLRNVRVGARRGLGQADLSKIRIVQV